MPIPPAPIRPRWAALLAVALCAAGCQRESDEITSYDAPRDPPRGVRMLGAVIPRGDTNWFFKMVGPNAAVSEQVGPFEALVKSAKFPAGGQPIEFQPPAGWVREPGGASRFATLRVPGPGKGLEVSVSQAGGTLLDNVNRWRRQIGLEPVTEGQLGEIARDVTMADGTPAKLVDMIGPRLREMPMGAAPGATPAAPVGPAADGLKYDLPPGWQEVPPRDRGITLKAFTVSEGGQTAEVTVTTLPGEGGGLLNNVNRWRGQLGLPPMTSPNELISASTGVEVDGQRGALVDFTAPSGSPPKRMVGVLLPRAGATWYFKMTGPADLVGRQKPALEAFLKSVRFGGEERGHP
jgi:hypothetical protein